MGPRRHRPDPAPRFAALQLWLANIALGTLVGTSFLFHVPREHGFKAWAFALAALVSTVATLTLLPGLLLVLQAWRSRSMGLLGLTQALVWTVFQILLFADTRIYNLFGYHFGAQVWDLLWTRGSNDALHLGWHVWGAVIFGLTAGSAAQIWLWRRFLVRAELLGSLSLPMARWFRPGLIWGLVLAPAIFVEKTLYAQADLARDRQVTALARLFPFYPRIPVDDLASRVLGLEDETLAPVDVDGVGLAWPLARPAIDPAGPRPSILVVVIDCWRSDMLDPEVTPTLEAFARESRRFDDHISGGNATRFGVFSMLYGLHGSYWFPVLAEQRSPLLVDVLLELGYDLQVFSGASMNYPELRSTAWSRVPERVHDAWPAEEPWRKDELATAACAEWLRARREAGEAAPSFGFLMLDSPHQTYSHPPDDAPFQPSAEELNYMRLSAGAETEPELLRALFNRYRNAVHHADAVVGGLLEGLRAAGELERTVVIVTGDHGEEFRENGFFGHTSNFSPEQVAVPLLVRGPGIEPGLERRPTSHLDLSGTLLELLGADGTRRADWTLGASLLDPPERRRRVVSGWKQLGLWTEHGIVLLPLHERGSFDIEVYDYDWKLVLEDHAVIEQERGAIEHLGWECRRFLALPARP